MSPTNRSCFLLSSLALLCICISDVRSEDRFSVRIVRWISPTVRAMDAEIKALQQQSHGLPEPERFNRSESMGYHCPRFDSPNEVSWVEVDLKKEQGIDQIAILPVFVEIPLFEGQSAGFQSKG